MRHPIVIVPGIGGSGPEHWQSLWQAEFTDVRRIDPASWDHPELDDWIAAIDRAVAASPAPPVLVAHSLGCLAVAQWASRVGALGVGDGADAASARRSAARPGPGPGRGPGPEEAPRAVAGAFLVAPPDIDGPEFPADVMGFGVPSPGPLPFAAVLVASSDDPYCSRGHAVDLAADWQAAIIDIGAHGHVNVASGFGPWPEGRRLLEDFVESQAGAGAGAPTRLREG